MRGTTMSLFDNKSVTVYNKYVDKITEKEIWLPTLIPSADYSVTKGANITASGMDTADAVKVYISKSALPKPYKSPIEWQALASSEKPLYVTFTEGTDFFVLADTASVTILASGFFAYMQKHYTDCYKITTVDRYEDILPHYEIGGK